MENIPSDMITWSIIEAEELQLDLVSGIAEEVDVGHVEVPWED